jgi:peptidyl-prolyl cis-trans isomerase B (cyclophilin B)
MKRISLNLMVSFVALISISLFSSLPAYSQVKKPVSKKTMPVAKKKYPAKRPVTPVKPKSNPMYHNQVRITTDSGVIVVALYDSTPLHRDNFLKLVKAGFYDSLLFHRVIPQFMIQGGDPLSKNAAPGIQLGSGGDDMERIPAEFNTALYHKKGALAAARDGNPEKKSSACQFYLVEGKVFTDAQIDMLEKSKGIKYTAEQRKMYTTVGGTPHLDQQYTVFGEVISGLDVIHKISTAARDAMDRPLGDVHMKMEVIK